MQIADVFTVAAPVEAVWAFLLDIDRMSRIVPGVETCTQVDERTYRGVVGVKLGPISARFGGLTTLTEVDPPRRLVANLQAEDKGMASLVQGTFTSTLSPTDTGTEVRYQLDVNLRGRLGQFGTAAILATSKKMTAEFTQRLRANLEQNQHESTA